MKKYLHPQSKRTKSVGRVKLVNKSSVALGSRELSLYRLRADGGMSSTHGLLPETLAAHSWHEFSLEEEEGNLLLTLSAKGLRWAKQELLEAGEEDGSVVIRGEGPGGDFEVEEDPENGPLSSVEQSNVDRLMLSALEASVAYDEVWSWVASRLGGTRTAEQLSQVYDFGLTPLWRQLYRPPDRIVACSPEELSSEYAVVDLYWRALDRFPGGNADFHTILFRFSLKDTAVECIHYKNWDGSHRRTRYQPKELDGAGILRVCRLLQMLPERNSECTLVDTASDREEYDSEWSSQEILVHIPTVWRPSTHHYFPAPTRACVFTFLLVNLRLRLFPRDIAHTIVGLAAFDPQSLSTVLRLHRRAIPGPNQYPWAQARNPPEQAFPPSPQQLAVLDACSTLVGMGRVNTFSDAGDGEPPCMASSYTQVNLIEEKCDMDSDLPYIQPMFFRNEL